MPKPINLVAMSASLSLAMTVAADAASLYLITPCAPIEILAGSPLPSLLDNRVPVWVDGKPAGQINTCDFIRAEVAPGAHTIRIKLSGASDYGISSEAGMKVDVGTDGAYLALDQYYTFATKVDTANGKGLISDVQSVRKK
jgi:hypothetical protein